MSKAPSKLHVFRAGKHTSAAGDSMEFSAADIAQVAASYSPAIYKAPIVVGHPTTDGPAYGWVGSLAADGNELFAEPEAESVEPQFAEMVNAGRFRNISVALWPPGHPSSPKKDGYYLKHVGFLGAQAPAVKGLKHASFAADDAKIVTIEFAQGDDAGILEKIKNILLNKSTSEPLQAAHFSASEGTIDMATQAELDTRAAELAAKETALKAREVAFAESEKNAKAESARATARVEAVEFAETMAKEGRILPTQKSALVESLTALHGMPEVEFSEDDGKTKIKRSPADALKDVVAASKKLMDFSEKSKGEARTGNVIAFNAPQGMSVDPERAAQHIRALEYAEKNKVEYAVAFAAIERGAA